MPDIIPPGFAQVLIPFRHASVARSAAVTFGVDMNGQTGSLALVDNIFGKWEAAWEDVVDTEVTMGPARLSVGQDGGENLVFVGSATALGASDQLSSPSNVALLVTKVTNRGGRRGRGRMYIPWCIADAAVNEVGIIPPANLAPFQSDADSFLDALDTDTPPLLATPMVLLHSASAPDVENPTTPGLPNPVVALQVQNLIGTQRRRLAR